MTAVKDGWMVRSLPVFFDDEGAARAFQAAYGGAVVRAKRHAAAVEEDASAWCSVDEGGKLYQADGKARRARPLGELTEDDFAC